ncbi:DUF5707 domain-containing protein [Streptomyces sp. NPDC088261]|uniref:DUF5707 domain-containing protein n=1 Tax=Streptomyces sp. NPDC088261 TaxID=3365851 RepID=UPI003809F57B
MSRRIVLSLAAAVVVLGGAGAFAFAHTGEQPLSLTQSTARYTAPDGGRDGSLTFTTEVTSASGVKDAKDVKDVKVLAWPAKSSFAKDGLTAKDMAAVESAVCEPSGEDTLRCTYTTPVSGADAAESPRGTWHVAVLVEAANGTTTLDNKAADFTVA